MKRKYYILIVLTLIFSLCEFSYSQRTCGSIMNLDEIMQNDNARYQRIISLENQIETYKNRSMQRGMEASTIIIPVVVHVVYYNSTQNISDAQINSQIDVLNQDYRRLNADRTSTPAAFSSVAADANIEFRLAKIDPNGNTTSGITRTSTSKTGFSNSTNDVKFSSQGGCDAWNSKKYLNIWVCNFSNAGLLGYAQFPSDLSTSPNTDGVVITYKSFGTSGTAQYPFNKGRTATHEVGHWLNLRHIWGDAYNCTATDFVDDTPNQYKENYYCPSFPLTDNCTTVAPGVMFMNYMDYTDDECMNIFTEGQAMRMHALFDSETGTRRDMLTDAEYLTSGCANTIITNRIYPSAFENLFGIGIRIFNIAGCYIEFSNTTIKNIATLTATASDAIVLKPNFIAQQGAKVIIKATGSSTLKSSNVIDNENEDTFSENVLDVQNATFVSNITEIPQTVRINIYSITGLLISTLDANHDVNSLKLNPGIYIMETIYDSGKVARKKIMINK